MAGSLIYSMIILLSAFEYSGGEPASLFPFTTAAETWPAPGVYRNPLSVTCTRGFTMSAYGSRPYSETGLHSYTSGLKYSSGDLGAQFLWHSFGTDFYRENRFTAGGGFSPSEKFIAACSVSAFRLDIDVEGESFSRVMYDADAALLFVPFNRISLSFVQNCVSTAVTGDNRYELYPERSAGILLKPSAGFSLSWNITDTAAGSINSFGAGISPVRFLSLRGGYTAEDSRIAGSLTIILKNINASYSLTSHPYLGYTHSFGITYSTATDIETVRYGTPVISAPEKKININSASPEEIRNIPGLSSRSSGRILLFREKRGSISEKALRQIGLNSDEIESVKLSCYGLARGSRAEDIGDDHSFTKKSRGRKVYIPQRERIKERFRMLIKHGIPAATAIRYSELPESAHRGDIESLLAEDSSLTGEQKDAVRRACSQ